MKKLLFIAGDKSTFSSVANRNYHISSYLSNRFDFYSIGGFNSNNRFGKLIRAILRRICLPDRDVISLPHLKNKIKQLNKIKHFDYFYVQVLPFSNLLLCRYLKKIAPSSLVIVEMTDPITINSSFPSFSWSKKIVLAYLENNILKSADRLVVLNEEIRNFYCKIIDPKQIFIIEQGTDIVAKTIDESSVSNLKGHIKFLYAGMLYKRVREPFELYNSISNSSHNISLNVIGDFKREFIPPQNSRFKYSHRKSLESISEEYNSTEVIVFIDNADSFQIPGKLFEVLSTCKPILFIYSNEKSPSLKYVENCKGIYITRNISSEINSAIDKICNTGLNYYQRNTKSFQWSTIMQKADRIFE